MKRPSPISFVTEVIHKMLERHPKVLAVAYIDKSGRLVYEPTHDHEIAKEEAIALLGGLEAVRSLLYDGSWRALWDLPGIGEEEEDA